MSNKLPEISARTEELDKCVNCGLCQSVCPTYLTSGNEGKTARGKITVMKEMIDGNIEPSSSILDMFNDCLSCYACQTICPAGVKTERLWTAARQDISSQVKSPLLIKYAIRIVLGNRFLLNFLTRILGVMFGFDRSDHRAADISDKFLFPFRGAPYLRSVNGVFKAKGDRRGKVGVLIGCTCNTFTPWVLDAQIKLLVAVGWDVILSKSQVCCGAPAINNGEWSTAKKLAIKNISIFLDLGVDYITSPDATCVSVLANDYKELFLSDEMMLPKVQELSKLIVNPDELIRASLEDGQLSFGNTPFAVTIHDSCHETHLEPKSNWRDILYRIAELKIVEMKNSDHCCGFGGSFAFRFPKEADKITQQKLENSRKTGVRQILVGSPGCLIKIQSSVKLDSEQDIEVRHVTELLADIIN